MTVIARFLMSTTTSVFCGQGFQMWALHTVSALKAAA